MVRRISFDRALWVIAGLAAIAVGIVGLVLPLLPTTPFMILAAFCFARGSQSLHCWLVDHPRFGPAILDWQRHRAIPAGAKRLAAAAMTLSLAVAVAAGFSWTIIGLQALAAAGVSAFVLTRPEPPEPTASAGCRGRRRST